MVATVAWFLMGNPFGIDDAYVALMLPLVVMGCAAGVEAVSSGRTGVGGKARSTGNEPPSPDFVRSSPVENKSSTRKRERS